MMVFTSSTDDFHTSNDLRWDGLMQKRTRTKGEMLSESQFYRMINSDDVVSENRLENRPAALMQLVQSYILPSREDLGRFAVASLRPRLSRERNGALHSRNQNSFRSFRCPITLLSTSSCVHER